MDQDASRYTSGGWQPAGTGPERLFQFRYPGASQVGHHDPQILQNLIEYLPI